MHLSKIKDIKTLNNLFETNQITCRIGVLGGRRFSIGKGKSFSLNQLLQKTVELSKKAPSEELDKALTGIKKLNLEGENKLSAASSCLKKLTAICRKLGGKFDNALLSTLEKKSTRRKLKERYSIETSKKYPSKNLEELNKRTAELNKRTAELQTKLDKTKKENEETQKKIEETKNKIKELQNKPKIVAPGPLVGLREPLRTPPGVFRHTSGVGTVPNLMGSKSGNITVIDSEKIYAVAVSSCFHTDERQEETLSLIQQICEKQDVTRNFFKTEAKKGYVESKHRLYNNLVKLHDALPGECLKKSVKLFWSEAVENVLIPCLLKNEEFDPKTLALVFTSGEIVEPASEEQGIFQAEKMDADHQLHFIGLDWHQACEEIAKGIYVLSPHVVEHDLLTEAKEYILPLAKRMAKENVLMEHTMILTFLSKLYEQLYTSYQEKKKHSIDFTKITF